MPAELSSVLLALPQEVNRRVQAPGSMPSKVKTGWASSCLAKDGRSYINIWFGLYIGLQWRLMATAKDVKREFKKKKKSDVIASLGFLSKGDKREKVVAVEKPAGTENVEDIEDQVGVNGHVLLGDARSSPALSIVAYGGTREDRGYSRGDLGRRHTGDGGGKWKRRDVGGQLGQAGQFRRREGHY